MKPPDLDNTNPPDLQPSNFRPTQSPYLETTEPPDLRSSKQGLAAEAMPSGRPQCPGHSLAYCLQKDFRLTSLCTSPMLTACEAHSKLTSELVNFCDYPGVSLLSFEKCAAAEARAHFFRK